MKTVKKSLLFLVVSYSGLFFGQFGINNEIPKATLDVVGATGNLNKADGVIAPRITGTQLRNKDNVYTAAQNGVIVYVTQPLTTTTTSAKTKNVLVKGYYHFDSSKGSAGQWVRTFYNPPKILAGGVTGNHHTGAAVTVISSNSSDGSAGFETRSIVVTERSLLKISVSVPVSNVLAANGTNLTDGISKAYGINLFLTGGSFNNTVIARASAPFRSITSSYAEGVFQLGVTRFLTLDPGTYTVNLGVYVYANNAIGIRADFGAASQDTIFDIISYPLVD